MKRSQQQHNLLTQLFKLTQNQIRKISTIIKRVFLISGVISVLNLALPLFMLHLIDNVFMTNELNNLTGISIVAGLAIVLQSLLIHHRDTLLSNHLLAQKYQGDNPQQTKNDKQLIIQTMELLWLPIIFGLIFALHFALGIFTLFIAIFTILTQLYQLYLSHKITDGARSLFRKFDRFHHIYASFKPFLLLKTSFMKNFTSQKKTYVAHLSAENTRTSKQNSFNNAFKLLSIMSMYGLGGILVINGSISAGSVIIGPLLLNYLLLPLSKIEPIFKAGLANANIQQLQTSSENNPVIIGPEQKLSSISAIDLTYVPKGADQPIFYKANFCINLPATISISAKNRIGKTQLLGLFCGLNSITRGNLFFEFQNQCQVGVRELKYPISLLLCEPNLIYGTIFENIRLFSEASDQDIMRLAMELGIHEFLTKLPDGYATIIDTGTDKFSQSELRMLAWMQLFIQPAKLKLIDNPEYTLDSHFKGFVLKKIANEIKLGCNFIFTTNDIDFVNIADKKFIIKNLQVINCTKAYQLKPALKSIKPNIKKSTQGQ
ncbi:MAG: ATP-binding cassette domain-containing protein [Rhizobiales bacterium]|nr:ATP-binding cassette domain-containing protein [Hyphomicrobiales bacterium]NRB15595.1 ATP-binding cassette domain-containing protein [Hyphomicrobiales bacterium]